jgi:hypothetical protein
VIVLERKWTIISEHVAHDDAGDPYYVAAGVRGVEKLEEWTEVVPASDLRGAVDALDEAVKAARLFNRSGMTWMEYDRLLARLEGVVNHARGQS